MNTVDVKLLLKAGSLFARSHDVSLFLAARCRHRRHDEAIRSADLTLSRFHWQSVLHPPRLDPPTTATSSTRAGVKPDVSRVRINADQDSRFMDLILRKEHSNKNYLWCEIIYFFLASPYRAFKDDLHSEVSK